METTRFSSYHLLAACARAESDVEQHRQIAQAAARITEWDAVPTLAEAHGMAPLAYRHLMSAGVSVPLRAKRELQGLSVRHRLANQVRTRVMCDILKRYESAGIRAMVLKGAALCHLLYPEPGLRPMRDLDLLVSKSDRLEAQRILKRMGFDAPLTHAGQNPDHRHLSAASLGIEGFILGVEVHHNLFEKGSSPILMGIENLSSPPISFSVEPGDTIAQTLGYEDTIWYLCQHLVESTNVFSSVGLIWVADIVSFAERFAEKIDWERVKKQFPVVLNTLSLLHFLTPLSDALVARAQIVFGRQPQGMWNDFRKLPRTTPEAQVNQGYALTLREALFPSEWWLRLHFELGSARPLTWQQRARHLAYLVRRLGHVMQRHLPSQTLLSVLGEMA